MRQYEGLGSPDGTTVDMIDMWGGIDRTLFLVCEMIDLWGKIQHHPLVRAYLYWVAPRVVKLLYGYGLWVSEQAKPLNYLTLRINYPFLK